MIFGKAVATNLRSAAPCAITPGRYKHFKGGIYDVLVVAINATDKNHKIVVYRCADEAGSTWARALSNFLERVPDATGMMVPRFTRIDPTED